MMSNAPTKVKVLVADGDRIIRNLIRTNLADQGFEIREAATAWDCVRLACQDVPDLLILDVNLPDHNGWEALALLRQAGALVDAAIIATGAELPSLTALRNARVSDFLRKPFDVRHLLARVDRAVAERRAGVTAAERRRPRSPAYSSWHSD